MEYTKYQKYTPYLPYIKEGVDAFVSDITICLIGALMFVVFGKGAVDKRVFLLFPLCLLIECFISYRILLLAFIEVHFNIYIKERLKLINVKKAPEYIGRWGTVLSKIYTENKYIEKNILTFSRIDDSTVKLRCVFYGERAKRLRTDSFSSYIIKNSEVEEVMYGKFSKVIISRSNGTHVRKSGMWNRSDF